MMFTSTPRTVRALGLLAVLTLTNACAANGRTGEASSYLIVTSMTAASGAKPSEFGGVLSSDVVTVVNNSPTILEDMAQVQFRLAMKDPTITEPSAVNSITVKGYRVTFSRSDGRNTPGVDVPYPFDGAMTATVSGTATASLVLVRVQAKLERPLSLLAFGGGAVVISTFADVVFYGTDQAGRDVTVTARISVNFADWGDPE
ncbi:MAG TPA: hypothetical protein PKW63_11230 [Vicinamibacterales bacterium]|nr:hypothetical protein [Acidobacteriota bacterium]HQX82321.1 hypothetical protein [Vicinamibacterales bacterium]